MFFLLSVSFHYSFFSYMHPLPPRSTLFPYTTLFRSCQCWRCEAHARKRRRHCADPLSPSLRHRDFDQLLHLLLPFRDRKSTRLNSSHLVISYAVFCLKKKKKSTQYPYKLYITEMPAK